MWVFGDVTLPVVDASNEKSFAEIVDERLHALLMMYIIDDDDDGKGSLGACVVLFVI